MTIVQDKNSGETEGIWSEAILAENSTIGQVIANLEKVGIKIVLVGVKVID